RDNVVRVIYEGSARFAWFVEKLDRTLSDSSGQRSLTASGRGILAWLEDAVVYPQGGLRETSSPERPFNYAAEDGPWKNSVTWSAPLGVRWRQDTSPRAGLPTNWPDDEAQWIWSTDPDDQTVPEGTVNYFRSVFNLTASTRMRFFATADNYFEMYLDGSLVMSSDRFTENAPSFSQRVAYTTRLGAGNHTIAVRARNGKVWERYDITVDADDDKVSVPGHGLTEGTIIRFPEIARTGTGLSSGTNYYLINVTENDFQLSLTEGGDAVDILRNSKADVRLYQDRYAGFIMTALKINADGRIDRTIRPVRRTNLIHWEVATQEPLFRPAMIVRTLIEEAQARGVYRLNKIGFGFDTSSPTTGSWTNYVDVFLKVGSDVLTVLDAMVDFGIDFWIDPVTCQLRAAEPRGASRNVRLEVARNLMRYETSQEPKYKTFSLVQNLDGWQQIDAGSGNLGRRETFVEAGQTRSPATARVITEQLLAELGRQRITASTIEAIVVPGCTPYVDFNIGDTIQIPAPDGSGHKRARVLSIAMVDDQGTARFLPELEVLDD
ncbi:MAG TPA: hypothetical protein VIG24_17440, partial [Acidimicrobiia bacterium]